VSTALPFSKRDNSSKKTLKVSKSSLSLIHSGSKPKITLKSSAKKSKEVSPKSPLVEKLQTIKF
jgi:hypothetical protein